MERLIQIGVLEASICDDIVLSSKVLKRVSFNWIPREANAFVDKVAKWTLLNTQEFPTDWKELPQSLFYIFHSA